MSNRPAQFRNVDIDNPRRRILRASNLSTDVTETPTDTKEPTAVTNEPKKQDDTTKENYKYIGGYGIVFNQFSDVMQHEEYGNYTEKILPGALDNINTDDIKLCYNHDKKFVIANVQDGTLKFEVNDIGLYFFCKLDMNIETNQMIYKAIEREILNQCSFAFTTSEENSNWIYDDKKGLYIREIKQFDTVTEISLVKESAYPKAIVITEKEK